MALRTIGDDRWRFPLPEGEGKGEGEQDFSILCVLDFLRRVRPVDVSRTYSTNSNHPNFSGVWKVPVIVGLNASDALFARSPR